MKKPKPSKLVCYGEVLWDCFPDREILGGAPFNVAFRLHRLGAKVELISAVGNDARGHEAYRLLEEFGLDTTYIHPAKDLATGYVEVALDKAGAATYTIAQPVAWDHIPAPDIPMKDNLLVFGSLALREAFNLSQVQKLIQRCGIVVFDINLRPPHYQMSALIDLMQAADCIKLNEEELPLVLSELSITDNELGSQLAALAKATQTATICVTLGSEGAVLWHEGQLYRQKGIPAQVVDTVGAGDAFLAAFIYGFYCLEEGPQSALKRGCALGSLVASTPGATTEISKNELQALLKD
ncbi:carbohydrate kinase family protein [Gilvibacter sediminis]|uniref:carbohydrate kinase family protein n=1 Tax=Gilvibacter sediminis TaxID=379071 RepID=UPI0023506CDE|nr:carbohydrate kinase [Gilvibacter sediminis]MDC7997319.1 carbohydrate kinase [Gilvibacter sediminis]